MFLFNLLEVSEQTTDIVTYITIGVLAVLAIVVAAVCIGNRKKKFDTKSLAYAAICLATSFVLSFIKIAPVPNGGSITLASWVPVLIYTYAYARRRAFSWASSSVSSTLFPAPIFSRPSPLSSTISSRSRWSA